MNRSNKSKIAVTLLSALAFGANAQAQDFNKNQIVKTNDFQINSTNSVQNSVKSGRVTIGKTKQVDWKTVVGGTIGVLAVAETVHSIIGAATDSEFGSYSIGRAIKNYAKKDNQPGGPSEQEKKNPDQKIDDKKDDKKAEDENLETVLGLFKKSAQIGNYEQLFDNLEQELRDFYKKIKNKDLKYADDKESIKYKLQEGLVDFFTHVKNYKRNPKRAEASLDQNVIKYEEVFLSNEQNGTRVCIFDHTTSSYWLVIDFGPTVGVHNIYVSNSNKDKKFRIIYNGQDLFNFDNLK